MHDGADSSRENPFLLKQKLFKHPRQQAALGCHVHRLAVQRTLLPRWPHSGFHLCRPPAVPRRRRAYRGSLPPLHPPGRPKAEGGQLRDHRVSCQCHPLFCLQVCLICPAHPKWLCNLLRCDRLDVRVIQIQLESFQVILPNKSFQCKHTLVNTS